MMNNSPQRTNIVVVIVEGGKKETIVDVDMRSLDVVTGNIDRLD